VNTVMNARASKMLVNSGSFSRKTQLDEISYICTGCRVHPPSDRGWGGWGGGRSLLSSARSGCIETTFPLVFMVPFLINLFNSSRSRMIQAKCVKYKPNFTFMFFFSCQMISKVVPVATLHYMNAYTWR
jgi:hypothetical protein